MAVSAADREIALRASLRDIVAHLVYRDESERVAALEVIDLAFGIEPEEVEDEAAQ